MKSSFESLLNGKLADLLKARGLEATGESKQADYSQVDVVLHLGQSSKVTVALEAENNFKKQRQAFGDAINKLKRGVCDVAVALCYPRLADKDALEYDTPLRYAIVWSQWQAYHVRDWHDTTSEELISLVQRIPQEIGDPDRAAQELNVCLNMALGYLSPSQQSDLAHALDLPAEYKGKPTLKTAAKRALLVIVSAALFHNRLDPYLAGSRPEHDARYNDYRAFADTEPWPPAKLQHCLADDAPISALWEAWKLILALDYRPILRPAAQLYMRLHWIIILHLL